jgi:hypothetical protein
LPSGILCTGNLLKVLFYVSRQSTA